jgi:PAS domain-containing protein
MDWGYIKQLIVNYGVAATAIVGAWQGYQKFIKPAYLWCKNQLGLSKKFNILDNVVHTHELKIDSLIKLSPFAIFMADHETGNIIYVNPAWCEMFDLTQEAAQGWYKHILEADKIRYSWQEMVSKKIFFDEKFTITSNNKQLLVSCKAVVEKNKHDKFVQIVGIIVEL